MDLLIFLVERRGELVTRSDIVDQLWGRDVFIEVEPAINTAIKKIRRALNDPAEAPAYVETVPGKGYRFVGQPTEQSPSALAPPVAAAPRRHAAAFGAGALLLVAIAAGWQLWLRPRATSGSPMQLVHLTTLTGEERGATFSPDGRQVAFTWNGEARANWDIYVKLIGSPEIKQLTTHPARDLAPRWSFDGRHIAYLRDEPSGAVERVRIISALGGTDRQLSDLAVLPAPSWSPDDQWIAVGVSPRQSATPGGIYLLPVGGGPPRQLTQSPAGGVDWMPAFSPDGRHLAYGSCQDFMSNCHMQVITLDATFAATGQPRRLTTEPMDTIRGVTWARNGAFVIFGAIQGPLNELWRAGIDTDASAYRIEMAASGALFPATALSADRLVFTRGTGR